MKVQLNHPGRQKSFGLHNGYRDLGGVIIREWNQDSVHFRKFIENSGFYLDGINDRQAKNGDLYFWGEWEGNSIFTPFSKSDYRILPNGLHKPYHATVPGGLQNTDPYVFGQSFKYCICKQSGQLTRLAADDLVLFGSVVPSLKKFYIDTVFVIHEYESSSSVQSTGGARYTKVYKEETLAQLHEYLKTPLRPNGHKVYFGKTWWDDKDYFSFVPIRLSQGDKGFERLYIRLDDSEINLSSNPTGKSFLKKCTMSSKELWQRVVQLCQEQDLKLGIRFTEPCQDATLNDRFLNDSAGHLSSLPD